MDFPTFNIARLPRIEFGRGVFAKTAAITRMFGKQVLLVTGGQSLVNSSAWHELQEQFQQHELQWSQVKITNEPSPDEIDQICSEFRQHDIDVVTAIGGGSVLDAAKAIAGLLKVEHSVMDFLEGVGPELEYTGPAVPFIAVPTTAGTGSEATKNAVLSKQTSDGFKKSFRDDMLVAEYAIVDPALLATCPPDLIAANGMDALTQLLESYVSLNANPLTDALAISGLRAARDGLLPWYTGGEHAEEAQDKMAYTSLLSGICLAQTGLGSVHGLASPLGAYFPIPHGVVCGTLVAEATRVNIDALRKREPQSSALAKYATLGNVICEQKFRDPQQAWDMLCNRLEEWTNTMNLQRLSQYGVSENDFEKIVANSRGSSMKTNPVILTDQEIKGILQARL